MNSVINFHRVTDEQWFDAILRFLSSKYELVSVDVLYDVCRGRVHANNLCHITVDDGDRSFCEIVLPALTRRGIPASLFVSPVSTPQPALPP